MKHIFTKTQAVSLLVQIKSGEKEVDLYKAIDKAHNLFNRTCEELEEKLSHHVQNLAGVVEDPVFLTEAQAAETAES